LGAQHTHQRKWWATVVALRVAWGKQGNHISPQNHLLHLLKEHLLAGFFALQIEG
jgi:hypothetical protein